MVEVVEISESYRDYWDEEIAKFEFSHPLNAFGWGKVRSAEGWSQVYLMAKRGNVVTGAMMILIKKIFGSMLSIMYAPRGPVWDFSDSGSLEALLRKVRMLARQKHAVFLRVDPSIPEDAFQKNDPLEKEGFEHLDHRWTFWNTPRDVYRIDISKPRTEDELFKILDKDARRCVRKAAKEGVTIRPAESLDELKTFYHIFKEVSVKKAFMSRGFAYQKRLWDEFISRGDGRLFLGIYEGKIIGGLICLSFARKCLAMHIGTSYEYQKLQTYYAYIWESIKWAKDQGCSWYSFRGVGTTPTQERFKKKFGPEVVSLVGYYDLPFYPLLYKLFYFGEFELLPRTWTILMELRKRFNNLEKKQQIRKIRKLLNDHFI